MASLIRVIASALVLAFVARESRRRKRLPATDAVWRGGSIATSTRWCGTTPPPCRVAPGARYTENGQRLAIGDGLWRSVKAKGKYRLVVADTEAQQVALIGTLEELNADPTDGHAGAGRVAAQDRRQRNRGDRAIHRAQRSTPRSASRRWAGRIRCSRSPCREAERMSRADLIATANKYFTGMQQNDGKGDYPFAADCNRIENGMQTTNRPTPAGETRPNPATAANYSAQWSCREQFESGLLHFVTRIRDRRFVAVDQERGLVFAFVFFDHAAGDTRNFTTPSGRQVTAGPAQPWTWYIAELFKIEKGQHTPDRSDARARAVRHDVRLEQLGRRHVGSRARRDALTLEQSSTAVSAFSLNEFYQRNRRVVIWVILVPAVVGCCAISSRSCSCRSCSRSSPRRSPTSACDACGCRIGPPSPSST